LCNSSDLVFEARFGWFEGDPLLDRAVSPDVSAVDSAVQSTSRCDQLVHLPPFGASRRYAAVSITDCPNCFFLSQISL
jgi:hypothetical protein